MIFGQTIGHKNITEQVELHIGWAYLSYLWYNFQIFMETPFLVGNFYFIFLTLPREIFEEEKIFQIFLKKYTIPIFVNIFFL